MWMHLRRNNRCGKNSRARAHAYRTKLNLRRLLGDKHLIVPWYLWGVIWIFSANIQTEFCKLIMCVCVCVCRFCATSMKMEKKRRTTTTTVNWQLYWFGEPPIFLSAINRGVSICADRRWNNVSRPYIEDFVSEFVQMLRKKCISLKWKMWTIQLCASFYNSSIHLESCGWVIKYCVP